MRWNDSATWTAETIWTDADSIGAIAQSEVSISLPNPTNAATLRIIKKMVDVGEMRFTALSSNNDFAVNFGRIYIDKIIVVTQTAETPQISAGTTAGGVELFAGQLMLASNGTVINVGKFCNTVTLISFNDNTGGDDWRTTPALDIYILYWKL